MLKRRLFDSQLVVPQLLFSTPTYPLLNKTCWWALHSTCSRMLRFCLGYHVNRSDWSSHVHTEDLYGYLPFFPTIVLTQHLRAWGHWLRDHFNRSIEHPVVDVFFAPFDQWKRRRGGQASGPLNYLIKITGYDNIAGFFIEHALDRRRWRTLVSDIAQNATDPNRG